MKMKKGDQETGIEHVGCMWARRDELAVADPIWTLKFHASLRVGGRVKWH